MDDKLIELCIMLGFFVFMKIWDGIRSGDDAKRLQQEIEEEEKKKEKSALTEKLDVAKTVAVDAVQEENTETAEDDPEETLVQKAMEDQDELATNERTWKCPRCGRINPAYQYACNCGNRFR